MQTAAKPNLPSSSDSSLRKMRTISPGAHVIRSGGRTKSDVNSRVGKARAILYVHPNVDNYKLQWCNEGAVTKYNESVNSSVWKTTAKVETGPSSPLMLADLQNHKMESHYD